jgi:hypothetical protein
VSYSIAELRSSSAAARAALDKAATARAALNVSVNDALAEAGNLFEMIEGDSQDIGTIEGRVGVLEKEGAKMVSLKVLFTAFGLARIARPGPIVSLRIPTRGLNSAHDLG